MKKIATVFTQDLEVDYTFPSEFELMHFLLDAQSKGVWFDFEDGCKLFILPQAIVKIDVKDEISE